MIRFPSLAVVGVNEFDCGKGSGDVLPFIMPIESRESALCLYDNLLDYLDKSLPTLVFNDFICTCS